MTRLVAWLACASAPLVLFAEAPAWAAPTTGTTQPDAWTNPNHAQVLHVLVSANKAEVDDGKVASTKASDPRVKELADHMVRDHTAALDKLNALSTKMKWTPEDNALSQKMEKEHQDAKAHLASVDGKDFDKAYVDLQVKMHKDLLDTIDQRLLPNVTDPALKTTITDMRVTVAEHLQHAQKLQEDMKNMK